MYLVKKQMGPPMGIMIVCQINQMVIIEPKFIKRHVEGLTTARSKGIGYALQQQSRLAYTSCTSNAQHPSIPGQLII